MNVNRIYEEAEKLRVNNYSAFMELSSETKEIWYRVHQYRENGGIYADNTNITKRSTFIERIISLLNRMM